MKQWGTKHLFLQNCKTVRITTFYFQVMKYFCLLRHIYAVRTFGKLLFKPISEDSVRNLLVTEPAGCICAQNELILWDYIWLHLETESFIWHNESFWPGGGFIILTHRPQSSGCSFLIPLQYIFFILTNLPCGEKTCEKPMCETSM